MYAIPRIVTIITKGRNTLKWYTAPFLCIFNSRRTDRIDTRKKPETQCKKQRGRKQKKKYKRIKNRADPAQDPLYLFIFFDLPGFDRYR